MRKIDLIVVHISASYWGTADVIKNWHTMPKDNDDGTVTYLGKKYNSRNELSEAVRKEKGNGWSRVGYHAVITNGYPLWNDWNSKTYKEEWDSKIEHTLDHSIAGIHARGHNSHSLAVCYIGQGNNPITNKQKSALARLLYDWRWKYNLPFDAIRGHYEMSGSGGKTCPNMDMREFRDWLAKNRLMV